MIVFNLGLGLGVGVGSQGNVTPPDPPVEVVLTGELGDLTAELGDLTAEEP